jgi:hypothetical protein
METGRRLGIGVATLREADWLGPQRARGWCVVLLLGLLLGAARTLTGEGLLDPFGKPIGTDFSSFWAASRLALEGRPLLAWDVAAHHDAQKALFGPEAGYYAFFYPPPFLLACLPLALLPYGWSLAAWLLLTGAAWWRGLRPILPQRWAMLALLGFPAVFVNATHGQNGFLTAALVGAAALALGPRPWVAGLCIGALAVKPHLGIAIPVALLAARRWTAFAASAAGVGLVVAVATLAFGTEAWRAFLATAPLARETLERGLVEPQKMVSVFAAMRLLGGGLWLAYGVQAVVALAVLATLAWLLRRRPGGVAEMAAVAAATPLCSPFLLDYDLMLLGLPLAFVLAAALREGRFLPWEKLVLLAAFVLPLVSRTIGSATGVPIAPLVTAALFWVVARRVMAARPNAL